MKFCQGSIICTMDSFQRLTYQKAWLIWAVILTCCLIIKYYLKIPKRKHCLINCGAWHHFINKQPLVIFKIARKCWWKSSPGVEIGIVKAYIKLPFQNSAGKEIRTFAVYHSWKTRFDYVGFFLLPSPTLLSSFPSLIIGLHLWF